MSTGLIIAIVVVVLLLLALLLFVLPRARARSRERQLERQRGEVASAHRERAETRMARAEEAEHIAERERAEAGLHETRARLHDRGLADDEVETEHGRIVERDEPAAVDEDRFERGGSDTGSSRDDRL
jgi:type II secretory pathway pseudopilin PulG